MFFAALRHLKPFKSTPPTIFSSPDPIIALDSLIESREDDRERRQWLRNRLWHNGPHADCCKKCFQAGYVIALARANRADLISEFPELVAVFKELAKDGLLSAALRR
jgi:hypothetical protein